MYIELLRNFTNALSGKKHSLLEGSLALHELKIIESIKKMNTIMSNFKNKIKKSLELQKKAKKIIPGGSSLFSKRPDRFAPGIWPGYFTKANGCKVWDLDNNEYIDMSLMGIGTNILGYCNPEVDEAVSDIIKKSNMSTFNCPEEVLLAEQLIKLHPWSDMVRFARTGGEANSIAIRIARAASGKEKVAICGYHGWHDWYLAANLKGQSNLDGHLMTGLKPRGVPKSLKNFTIPFIYNDIESLKKIINDHEIGIIKMEVSRSSKPEKGFLESVRELATENNIILIFDECTSGFRETLGGLHKKYKIIPDMAIFGKALGNGYAITAVIGKEKYMLAAEKTFISSTFWTERIGPVAALKTLEIMQREKSWEKITKIGSQIKTRLKKLASKYNIKMNISGIPSLISFTILTNDWLKYKTFITQEMLKRGYLASNAVYVCTQHNTEIIDGYFKNLEPIFARLSDFEEGDLIEEYLESKVCRTGFQRLN